ncbi:hypothetical protein CHS0354_040675 [Potamilus streckersoni]|uniref:non-specific serine/threonine protein kinase n=1 Tax=Potamilus streckersoni TaxID=2493646 RepID=A0AAE0WAT8_9BIVA|nr:hypothetical protein CHS0354_040675 [Potamilus streckersoni]
MFWDNGRLYVACNGSSEITVFTHLYQGVPLEILKMDDRSIQLFEEALKAGKENVYNIRVMVVGHVGVGKTTLIKRLLREEVDISERRSTEGVDVYVNCCDVSLSSFKWKPRKNDIEQDRRLQRLVKVLIDQMPTRNKVIDDEQAAILSHGVRTDNSAHITDKEHVLVSSEKDGTLNSYLEAHVFDEEKDAEVLSTGIHSLHKDFGQNIASTASQEKKSTLNAAQTTLSQSETSTIAMLKLLKENADKLKQDAVKYIPMTIWDFAGQYAFYTTHQTFLTRRAIYLLVSDISGQVTDFVNDEYFFDSEGIVQCRVHDLIEVWINSIHSCSPSPESGIPPVILVGTHVDKISQYCHEICEKYFGKIRSYLRDKPTRFHLVNEDFAINNTIVDRKLEDLRRKIVEVASHQPYWGEEIPAHWIPLEQELMRLKAAGIKVIPLSLLEDMNKAGAVQISKDELNLFLRFQHDIGTILYFSKEVLKMKIVLDPQWMIDALKSLITAEMFVLRNTPAVSRKWFEFKENGKLFPELIDAIWMKDNNPDLFDNREHILLLMEQMNIISKPKVFGEDALEVKEENYYLAPCMLRQETPQDVICPKPNPQMETSSVLCYVFTNKFLPSPIFHRLLAACVAHWPLATKKKETVQENQIYCGCCVFQLDQCHKLILHFREYVIFVRVTRMGIKEKTPSSEVCTGARVFITAMLSEIIGCLSQNLSYELFIQCPEYNGVSVNSLLPVSFLQENAEVRCDFHDNMIESYNLLKFWFKDQEQSRDVNASRVNRTKRKAKQHISENLSRIKRKKKRITALKRPVAKKISNTIQSDVPDKAEVTDIKDSKKTGVSCSDPELLCQVLKKSTQVASSKQKTLEENCQRVGLKFHGETPGNGNCFFEAVSSQLQRLNCAVQKSAQQLRQDVVAFMKANAILQVCEGTINLAEFISDDNFNDYCERMARDGEWADHVVVVGMARMLQMDIMIVTSAPSSGPENIIAWVVSQTNFNGQPILLGHIYESHFKSLQPIDHEVHEVQQCNEGKQPVREETATQTEQEAEPEDGSSKCTKSWAQRPK